MFTSTSGNKAAIKQTATSLFYQRRQNTSTSSSNITELRAVPFIRSFEFRRQRAEDIEHYGILWDWKKEDDLTENREQAQESTCEKFTLP